MGSKESDTSLSNPLVLDVSSSCVQSGIATENGWRKLVVSSNPPMNGVFQTVAQLIKELKIKIGEIDSIFFCAGPGSTLGLRLASAFIKTMQWQKEGTLQLYSYNALDLACQMAEKSPLILQAPFRMGWRIVRSSPDQQAIGKKEIFESEEALQKFPTSLHLKDLRKNAHLIDPQYIIDYQLNKINGLTGLLSVSELVKELEVYSPRPPQFKKWTPSIQFLSPNE
jgi:hypothetical protein